MIPEALIYVGTALVISSVSFVAGALVTASRDHRMRNETWAEAEKLFRDRAIKDMRDETSAKIDA